MKYMKCISKVNSNSHSRLTLMEFYTGVANLISRRSRDPSTQVGAVIIIPDDNIIVSMGYNGMPRVIDDNIDSRYERPNKYFYFEHAERNAIYNSARCGGYALKGCHIICTHFPCADCARSIIQVGIKKVLHIEDWDDIPKRRRDSCRASLEIFGETGVVCELLRSK